MIAELLNDEFLLAAAEDTRLELTQTLGRRERRAGADTGPLAELHEADIRAAAEELQRAVRAHHNDPRPERDAAAWMPREPILAILQSELSRLAREQHPDKADENPVTPERFDEPPQPAGDQRRAFGRYEVTRPKILSDPRWLWSGVVIAWHRFKHPAPFGGLPVEPQPIAPDARIVLVGDWGSGLPRARAVAGEIRGVLQQGAVDGREQHVIHLGDVYYTGAKDEYEQNLLADWPVKPGEAAGSWTLCGNHDMYRGGHHYYDTALADARFRLQQRKSVFALQSPSWQILALDTAHAEKRLAGGQAAWLAAQLAAQPGLRSALLSHHQLWSPHEPAGEQLREELQPVLDGGGVDAWFWGHEHRCMVLKPQHHVRFASCVGHGGIPEYIPARQPPGVRYEYRARHGHGVEPWGTFGFAVLELDGPRMEIRYIDEHGRTHHREEIT